VTTWTKLEVRGDVRPPARSCHTASVFGNDLYVFGGHGDYLQDNVIFNDLWKLDLSTPEVGRYSLTSKFRV